MSIFHAIRSLSFSTIPPFFKSIYGNFEPPVSLYVREISAQTIEDTFIGLNPPYPYSIINTCTNDCSIAHMFLQRIISDIKEVFKKHQSLYCIEELRRELNVLEFLLVDRTHVVNFYNGIYKMMEKEITWLNETVLSTTYLQQTNIVYQSFDQLVFELTFLEQSVDRIFHNMQKSSESLLQPESNFETPMDIFDGISINSDISTTQCQSDYYDSTVVSVNELREIVHCFVGKRLTTMWNYQKQLEAVGIDFHNSLVLEEISPKCQSIYTSFLNILKILDFEIRKCVDQIKLDQQRFLFDKAFHYFQTFLQSAFFVYQQPPLVIQTVTKMYEKHISREGSLKEESIPVSTCLLPAPGINLKERTTMYSINEKCLKTLYADGLDAMLKEQMELQQFNMGEPKRKANYLSNRNIEVTEFDGARLESRIGKRNASGCIKQSKVVEEKCCVLFVLQVEMFGQQLKIWTTSLPVSISSHKVQEGLGMAVIIRDYLSARMIRAPCDILAPGPEYITWDELSKIILYFFRKFLGNWKLKLSKGDLICIKRKAAEAAQLASKNDGKSMTLDNVKWAHLCENVFLRPVVVEPKISEMKFCFWDWVYAAVKTIQLPKVTPIWEKGILRFIDRYNKITAPLEFFGKYAMADSELMSGNRKPKTFLLRFSDTYPGAISIVFIGDDGVVYHNPPFMHQDVNDNSLAKKIKEDSKLLYIQGYGIENTKDTLLKEFYPKEANMPGYKTVRR